MPEWLQDYYTNFGKEILLNLSIFQILAEGCLEDGQRLAFITLTSSWALPSLEASWGSCTGATALPHSDPSTGARKLRPYR